jgi:hypothetical protein
LKLQKKLLAINVVFLCRERHSIMFPEHLNKKKNNFRKFLY